MMKSKSIALLLAVLAVLGCAPTREAACPVCQPCAKCPGAELPPPAKPLQAARWDDLPGWRSDDLVAAWPVFLQSCRGLANKAHWQRVCGLARGLDGNDGEAIRRFFETHFTPYALTNPDGSREGLVTGYYEPLLVGSRAQTKRFAYPVLGVPDDLITVDLGEVVPDVKHLRLRGRLQGKKIVPYYSRAEIEAGAAPHKSLFWVEDVVELFFLQIQGSGRIRLPDGKLARVGYADQNGHPYHSIGRLLIERGELKPGEASMQGIQAWARANPRRLAELLNANPSYVFFRELPASDGGPLGALGIPLTAGRSLAVDPRSTPLGAPVFLATTQPNSDQPLTRLAMAQDTGGAIKGVVRADYFWGFGAEAGEAAGRMKQRGRMWVLLPPEAAPK